MQPLDRLVRHVIGKVVLLAVLALRHPGRLGVLGDNRIPLPDSPPRNPQKWSNPQAFGHRLNGPAAPCWPVSSAARVGEHSAATWKRLYRTPSSAIRLIAGVLIGPPNALGLPNPASSTRISSTLGAPSGGLTCPDQLPVRHRSRQRPVHLASERDLRQPATGPGPKADIRRNPVSTLADSKPRVRATSRNDLTAAGADCRAGKGKVVAGLGSRDRRSAVQPNAHHPRRRSAPTAFQRRAPARSRA